MSKQEKMSAEPTPTTVPTSVHLILQGKGGVGKSLVSSLLAQYLQEGGQPLACIDTDPVNATFAGYKAFDVQRVELMENNDLQPRRFDAMLETVFETDKNFVIDNGATSFLPLSNYLLESGAWQMFVEYGKRVVVHTVVTGGQSMFDTLHGFDALARQLPPEIDLVVWVNEYFGHVEAEGKPFEEMKVYQQHKGRVAGLVRVPKGSEKTFGVDIAHMLDRKLTFAEVAQSPDFGLMARSRLARIKAVIFDSIRATRAI